MTITLRRTTLLAALAMLCTAASAQRDSIIHRIEAEVLPSVILHTNEYLKGDNPEIRTMNHAFSARLKYGFMKSPETRDGQLYKGAYQGVGVAWHEFNPQLHNPFSAFIYQGATIKRLNPRVAVNYEWNLGVTFGWNPYNADTNPDNRVIGSKVTAYIDADFYLNWRLSSHFDINAGVSFSHFSNGNTQLPNSGLNIAGLKVGIVYRTNGGESNTQHPTPNNQHPTTNTQHPNNQTTKRPDDQHPTPNSQIHTDIVAFGAWKRMAYLSTEGVGNVPASFAVGGLNINPLYRVNHLFNAGLSLDLLYDHSANIIYDDKTQEITYPSTWNQMAAGLSARAELVMPYFTINMGLGHHLLHAKGHLSGWYEVLALKTKLTDRLFLHIGYSLVDFKSPNHLMLGMGVRIGKI
ncbi:MAG: acyloxyacyl hydrolase [Prevotella sp.]|nr:acyloxyacyl hydrolase [Prevotella sp.]